MPELTCLQRRQLGSALDNLTDASSHLSALIESEPDGTRDLLLVREFVERCLLVLMARYAEPVPPVTPARHAARVETDHAA